MPALGVNIDHVATVREARKTNEPDPVWAATFAELGGADAITVHLREDRRHIQERDLRVLVESVAVPINLELACADDVLSIACDSRPFQVTLVPERREEVTTEGGLDVVGGRKRVAEAVRRLKDAGIVVSLFLDPDPAQIGVGAELGVDAIELHTGAYAHASAKHNCQSELETLDRGGQAGSCGGAPFARWPWTDLSQREAGCRNRRDEGAKHRAQHHRESDHGWARASRSRHETTGNNVGQAFQPDSPA